MSVTRLIAIGALAVGLLQAAGPAHAQISLFQAPSLMQAVTNDDLNTLRALLRKGENANIADGQGRTPLIIAISKGNREMATVLLDNGAQAGRADGNGNTPLHWAAQEGNTEMVDLLLGRSGVKVDQENRQGLTPLMTAAREGHAGAVEQLLKAGAKVDRVDFTGRTVLSWADEGRNGRVTSLLRRAGAR